MSERIATIRPERFGQAVSLLLPADAVKTFDRLLRNHTVTKVTWGDHANGADRSLLIELRDRDGTRRVVEPWTSNSGSGLLIRTPPTMREAVRRARPAFEDWLISHNPLKFFASVSDPNAKRRFFDSLTNDIMAEMRATESAKRADGISQVEFRGRRREMYGATAAPASGRSETVRRTPTSEEILGGLEDKVHYTLKRPVF